MLSGATLIAAVACSSGDSEPGGKGGPSTLGTAGAAGAETAGGAGGNSAGGGGAPGGLDGGAGGAAGAAATCAVSSDGSHCEGTADECTAFKGSKYDAAGGCIGPYVIFACGRWGPMFAEAFECWETFDASGNTTGVWQTYGEPMNIESGADLTNAGVRQCTDAEKQEVWMNLNMSPPNCP